MSTAPAGPAAARNSRGSEGRGARACTCCMGALPLLLPLPLPLPLPAEGMGSPSAAATCRALTPLHCMALNPPVLTTRSMPTGERPASPAVSASAARDTLPTALREAAGSLLLPSTSSPAPSSASVTAALSCAAAAAAPGAPAAGVLACRSRGSTVKEAQAPLAQAAAKEKGRVRWGVPGGSPARQAAPDTAREKLGKGSAQEAAAGRPSAASSLECAGYARLPEGDVL